MLLVIRDSAVFKRMSLCWLKACLLTGFFVAFLQEGLSPPDIVSSSSLAFSLPIADALRGTAIPTTNRDPQSFRVKISSHFFVMVSLQ